MSNDRPMPGIPARGRGEEDAAFGLVHRGICSEVEMNYMDGKNYMQQFVDQLIREQYARLEEEGRLFLKMGYAPEELTIVCHGDGSKEIAPLSAL